MTYIVPAENPAPGSNKPAPNSGLVISPEVGDELRTELQYLYRAAGQEFAGGQVPTEVARSITSILRNVRLHEQRLEE